MNYRDQNLYWRVINFISPNPSYDQIIEEQFPC